MAKRFTNLVMSGFGNLVDNPKKFSGNNSDYTTVALRVAVNSKNTDKRGNEIEDTEYLDIILFGWEADQAMRTMRKGDRIHFAGDAYPKEYTNRDGDVIRTKELHALRKSVFLAPWPEDLGEAEDDGYDDEPAPSRGSRQRKRSRNENSAPSRGSRQRKRSRASEEVDDLDEDILGDDFEDDAAPKRPSRSRSRSVQMDDDLDDYEEI